MQDATTQNDGLNPDQAMAALAFANHLSGQINGFDKGATDTSQSSENAPQSTENPTNEESSVSQETPSETGISEPDKTSNLEGNIKDLENTHKQEIMELRLEIEKGKSKETEKKLEELDTKHKKEIEDLKSQVKSILNGQSQTKKPTS